MIVSPKNPNLNGDVCPDCNGKTTTIADFIEVDCPTCHGTGVVNSPNACKSCFGSGTTILGGFIEVDCPDCNGSGLEPETSENTLDEENS